MSNVAIIGAAGKVGQAYNLVFPNAYLHDPTLPSIGKDMNGRSSTPLSIINKQCELAIVCVPTPSAVDGSCDTSIVEEVVDRLSTPLILIKSTVAPGTTDRLRMETGKRVCMSPEYIGSSGGYHVPGKYPDPIDPRQHGFMVIGGDPDDCSAIIDVFLPVLGPSCRYRIMDATSAELVKLLENSFIAMKVTFANEMRQMCDTFGVNYHIVREGWLDDPRVGDSHSAAFSSKMGWGGHCLPKDTANLVHACKQRGFIPHFMEAVIRSNKRHATSK